MLVWCVACWLFRPVCECPNGNGPNGDEPHCAGCGEPFEPGAAVEGESAAPLAEEEV